MSHGLGTTTEPALGASSQPAIGAGFPTSTYWSAPIKSTGTYVKIEPTPLALLEPKIKRAGLNRAELKHNHNNLLHNQVHPQKSTSYTICSSTITDRETNIHKLHSLGTTALAHVVRRESYPRSPHPHSRTSPVRGRGSQGRHRCTCHGD